MKTITIKSQKHGIHTVLVDDEDFELVNSHKWRVNKNGKYIRPVTNILPRQGIKLHHLIMPKKDGFNIDHIDRNPFNNQKANLRYATISQNGANCCAKSNNKATGFKGVNVHRDKNRSKRFGASIKVNYKRIWLGWYSTPIDAALAYNEAAKKYYSEFAWLNPINNG